MDKADCFLHWEPLLAQPPLYLRCATEWGLVDWGAVVSASSMWWT